MLDEPSAANAVYQIEDGVIVDIGGGTTGLAILQGGKVVQIEDEPTGGTHLTLVLAGITTFRFQRPRSSSRITKDIVKFLPVLKAVVEKNSDHNQTLCKYRCDRYDLSLRRYVLPGQELKKLLRKKPESRQ